MKCNWNRLQRIFLWVLLFSSQMLLYAYDFEVDGVYYNKLSDNEVEITYKDAGLQWGSYNEIKIPTSVKYGYSTYNVIAIGNSAFSSCTNIKGPIIIPNNIKSIGKSAFANCSHLTDSLVLPKSVTSIGSAAFYGCNGITTVKTKNEHPFSVSSTTFEGVRKHAVLVVPKGAKAAYQGVDGWGDFLDVIDEGEAKVYVVSVNTNGNGSFGFNGKKTSIAYGTSYYGVLEGNSPVLTIYPNDGFRLASLIVDDTDVTSNVVNNSYTINNIHGNHTIKINFEYAPPQYSLSIKSIGCGSIIYNKNNIRETTANFDVDKGTSATITLNPDEGYRVKSLIVNSIDVTSSISNNTYTISNINANTNVEADFEAIPPTTYTLSIKATGNGTVTYGGTSVKGNTSTFSVNAGTSVTITLAPDDGYRLKSLTVNNQNVTSGVSNNTYIISSINANTIVEAVFEVIPTTGYTLTFKATGNGTLIYGNESIRNTTSTFTVNKGTSVTVTLSPDGGYRVKNLTVNNTDVTLSISNNKYTISSINANTTIEAVFEVIPSKTYTLSIKATGNGTATYGETSVRGKTNSFTVIEGSAAIIVLSPDNGYWTKSILQDAVDVTASVNEQKYVIASVKKNISIEISFAKNIEPFSVDGNGYSVSSHEKKTVMVNKINSGKTIEIPAQVSYQNYTWSVVGIDNDAIKDNKELAAIIWNPSALFNASVDNPNVLLYVTSADYAPTEIANVVVNGNAEKIILKDATNGNDFYCPKEFTAKTISYTHNYGMTTGYGEAKGWESIVLPFDVQKVEHPSKGELIPYSNWKSGDAKKPFWLMEYGTGGWTHANKIKANTPYIISMPNHTNYKPEFRVNGSVTFSADNAKVKASDNIQSVKQGSKSFVPNYSNQASASFYSLNINSDYTSYTGEYTEGSRFVLNLRPVHPFEAYMTSASNATRSIEISADMTTGLRDIIEVDYSQGNGKIYNLKGLLIKAEKGKSIDETIKELPAGVYIVNGKKLIIK